jgi:hypothetical protein
MKIGLKINHKYRLETQNKTQVDFPKKQTK